MLKNVLLLLFLIHASSVIGKTCTFAQIDAYFKSRPEFTTIYVEQGKLKSVGVLRGYYVLSPDVYYMDGRSKYTLHIFEKGKCHSRRKVMLILPDDFLEKHQNIKRLK